MADNWMFGNANDDAAETRGWLVGHFLPPSVGVRADDAVEVKWANHPVGDTRQEWTSDDQRTTLVMLVQGEFRVDLTTPIAPFTNVFGGFRYQIQRSTVTNDYDEAAVFVGINHRFH